MVSTIDVEILSKIAVHNFEKNRKIESAMVPNRRILSIHCIWHYGN